MEYCIRILGRGARRKRGVSILGVLTAILLTVGQIDVLTALKSTDNDTVYNHIYDKDMGRELHSFGESPNESGVLDIFSTLMVKIPVKADISSMVDANRKAGSETPHLEETGFLSDILISGMEVPVMTGTSGNELPDLSDIKVRIPEMPTGNFTPPVIPNIPAVNEKPSVPETPAVPDKPIIPDEPIVPDTPAVPDTPIVPDNPPIDDNPAEPPDVVIPDNPVVPGENEDPDSGAETPGIEQPVGFTVNEEGMICGFDPSAGVVNDGRLVLPSENCTGLASGTFEGVSSEIYELFIPPNIVSIDPGALGEMSDLEWIDLTEPNQNYVCSDGMLFDSSMTTLLVFPRGRIGTYSLPSYVTRLEDYSLLNTGLTKIDMMKCGAVEVGSNVFGANGGNGIIIMAPRNNLEHYQNVFDGLGVTIQ